LTIWDPQSDIASAGRRRVRRPWRGGFGSGAVDELIATAQDGGEYADEARAALALLLRLADRGAREAAQDDAETTAIADRDIELPDSGVVVISGANEIASPR